MVAGTGNNRAQGTGGGDTRTRRDRPPGPEKRNPSRSSGAGRVPGAAPQIGLAVRHEARAAAELQPQYDGVCPRPVVVPAGEGHEGQAETYLQLRDGFQTA